MSNIGKLRHIMLFPARAYLKYNGYLGIIGYDSETGLFISTKSSNQGPLCKKFKDIILSKIDKEKLENFVKEKNISLIFEVIDPINDPHIIEYKSEKIILLDCIDRTWDFQRSFNVYDIGKELGFEVKECCYELKDYNEFYQLLQETEKYDFKYFGEIVEGFVIEDSANFMVKIKTEYYKFWKKMRSVLFTLAAGKPLKLAMLVSPLDNQIYAFMKEKGRDYLKEKSIIQIRNEFENN